MLDAKAQAGHRTGPLDTSSMKQVIGYRLRRAQAYVFQQFVIRFTEVDLRPAEYSVLVLIADNPGCKQGEIAEVLGIKRANFVGLMNQLDARGLTTRSVRAGDKRSNALYLTEAGDRFVAEVRGIQDEFERHCIDKLGGVEARDQFLALLDRLTPDRKPT